MDELDNLIRNSLDAEVNCSEQDIDKNFIKFKTNLIRNQHRKYHFSTFSYIDFKRVSVILICCLVCTTTILISSSSTVRAAALDAIDSIKSIFVVEYSGKKATIVQKPATEVKVLSAVSTTTFKSDAEVGELIGYRIVFPKTLDDIFILDHRNLCVALNKELPYDFTQKIQQQMLQACTNEEEFTKLSEYSPYRYANGVYKNDAITIYISSSPIISDFLSNSENEKVRLGDIEAYWCKFKYPDYPFIAKNNAGEGDFSVKPEIKEKYTLDWVINDIYYSLSSIEEGTLSKEEAIKIATEFQAAQK